MSREYVIGDCIEVLKDYPENHFDSCVTDPPYGLEFMGKEWDRLTAPGIGERPTDWPSFSSTARLASPNPTCARCGGRLRGKKKCQCEKPEWKPIGKRRKLPQGTPEYLTGGGMSGHLKQMQAWHTQWAKEVYRVLKPGAHLLAMGGTRTSHRLACALEDAGFEIRDTLMWLYGSGFPKSLDVSKAIDKMKGAERQSRNQDGSRESDTIDFGMKNRCTECGKPFFSADPCKCPRRDLEAITQEAAQWQGWGTALKPAYEPIILARKPLESTVAANVLKHGTGGMNIDATRIAFSSDDDEAETKGKNRHADFDSGPRKNAIYGTDDRDRGEQGNYNSPGRWPANVILTHHPACVRKGMKKVKGGVHGKAQGGFNPTGDTLYGKGRDDIDVSGGYPEETVEDYSCHPDCPIRILDAQSGHRAAGAHPKIRHDTPNRAMSGRNYAREIPERIEMDSGGASRFFYIAKASREERERGLGSPMDCLRCKREPNHGGPHIYNHHPTVKPIELMRYLIRLVTPPDGLVLDPFVGSGTTLLAARIEGMDALGIEKDAEMESIIKGRLSSIPPPLESFSKTLK